MGVVVWHAYDQGKAEEAALLEVARQFTVETGVEVDVVAVPFGVFESKIETAIPNGNGPDLFIAGHNNVAKWTGMGLIEPADQSGGGLAGVDALKRSDVLMGVPIARKCVVLLYDPTVVTEVPGDTDALVALATRLTGDGRYGLAYEAATPYYHAPFMHGFGGALFVEGSASLDSDGQIAALGFVGSLAGILPPQPTPERVGRLYDEGLAAMVISGPWFVDGRSRPIAAALLPTVSATGLPAAPYLTIETAYVAAHGHEPGHARRFANFLARSGADERRDIGHQVTTLEGMTYEDPLLAVVAQQADSAVPFPTSPDIGIAFEAQARALRAVLRGNASPEAAAADAQAWFDKLAKPPPPEAPIAPYAVLAGLVGLVGTGWAASQIYGARAEIAKRRHDYVWLAPSMLALGVLVVGPFLVGSLTSLYFTRAGSPFTFVGFSNFADILLQRDWPITSPMSFVYSLVVTVLWTVVNVVLHVSLGVVLALALREPWIRLRAVWRVLLVVPWAVPNYITALVWRTMFDTQMGAINRLLALFYGHDVAIDWFGRFSTAFAANVATNTWLGFPFMMVVALGALQAVPKELEEAAILDGASYFERLRLVIWPQLKPALLPAVVLGSVWTFNQFNVIYLVSAGEPDGATDILVSQAYKWAFSRGNLYGYAAAYALIVFGVLLLWSQLTDRVLRREDPR